VHGGEPDFSADELAEIDRYATEDLNLGEN
jgi:hypothetical protein